MTKDAGESGTTEGTSRDLAKALPLLTPEQLAEVSPKLVRQVFRPGSVIIEQGDMPDRFYIIIRGHAEVLHQSLSGKESTVDVRKPGEYFGEIGLLKGTPRSATVRASEEGEVEVLALEREDFQALIDESRGTEAHVARDMIQRLIRLADYQS